MRSEHTPDCLVTGCARAAHKFGVCRYHHSLLPLDFKLSAMSEVFAAHDRNNKRAARMAAHIERTNRIMVAA